MEEENFKMYRIFVDKFQDIEWVQLKNAFSLQINIYTDKVRTS